MIRLKLNRKQNVKRIGVMCLSGLMAFSSIQVDRGIMLKAAGKTVEAYESNSYGNTSQGENKESDAEYMYNGIKSYDSAYKGEYKEKSKVSNSNFYSKSRTIKYWASEGNEYGILWGNANGNTISIDIFNDKKTFSWSGSNLEFVFLAACNQLNKEGSNPVKRYAKAMLGDKAVRVICGYHSNAPKSIDTDVVKQFLKWVRTGESVKSSWIKANEYYVGKNYTNVRNYAVLTHSGNAQYSRFPGFSSTTYTRPGKSSKKIIRFRRGVESGEKIVSVSSLKKSSIEKKVPSYRLKAIPVKVFAKRKCKDMVFNEENTIITDGGEIASKEIDISREKIYKISSEYFKDNLNPKESTVELKKSNMVVAPIVVSDACTDEEETNVAYSVHFQNTYENIPIEGDGYNVIIDSKGVKYSSTTWHNYQKEEIDTEMIDIDQAVDIACDEMKKETLRLYKKGSNNQLKEAQKIKKVSVAFVYNGKTGYYEPVYQFDFDNDITKEVSCIDGELLEGVEENDEKK